MSTVPEEHKPPVQEGEFIARITDPEDERIDVGVLFVGAGPASLAGAIRLAQLLEQEPEIKETLGDFPIAIVEKGRTPGAHLLSGAVVNPVSFRQLFPDMKDADFPFFGPVPNENVYFLTSKKALKIPTPPSLRNHGYFTASLSQIGRWLGEKAEQMGVTILNETAGVALLVENGTVRGIHAGDKGLDRDGKPLGNHEPGSDVTARMTVLGEGGQGHLTTALWETFGLASANPQTYALGVKEIWEVPKPLNRVIHTMGWPLRSSKKFNEFGGSFCYPMGENLVSIGLVIGLDYTDADVSPHDLMQQMKGHPLFAQVLAGGQRAKQGWGAKTIPEGGFYSLPDRFSVPGAVLIGDSAGFVNVPTLKGIHYAMHSGILAADAIFDQLKAGTNAGRNGALVAYDEKIKNSVIWKDLYRVRNMRQAFHGGFFAGAALAGLMTLSGGRFPGGRFGGRRDSALPMFRSGQSYAKPDGKTTFDKLDSVYASGNASRDNQPNHVRLATSVPKEIGETWIHMCPAQVYEWKEGSDEAEIEITGTNCVQCNAISAKGGRLTPPEGGSGPVYTQM